MSGRSSLSLDHPLATLDPLTATTHTEGEQLRKHGPLYRSH